MWWLLLSRMERRIKAGSRSPAAVLLEQAEKWKRQIDTGLCFMIFMQTVTGVITFLCLHLEVNSEVC